MFRKEKLKHPVVLSVSSGGGHWVQLRHLSTAFDGTEVHYATTDASAVETAGTDNVHVYPDANQTTPFRLIACMICMAWLILRIRPDVVVSTGAAGGFVAIRLAKILGARTMFIDSIANARKLSISARLSLGVADRVLSQWPTVAQKTGAEYQGALI